MYLFCLVVLQTLLQLLKQLPILLVRFFIYSEPPINAPDAYPKNVVHKLHGLIIGIDRYRDPKLPVLSGAVNDANSIRQFLIDDLGTSPSHITYLLDTQATREGIIQAIQALRKNPKIRHGDPILIYFAGHGGANDAREEWRARHKGAGKIQFIFPYDFGEDCNGKEVIPDKTIACLLNELAAAKGNNITVIFDSCHSASGSRSSEMGGDGRHARSADLRPEIPLDIDCDIIGRSPATTATSASRHTESPFCTNQNSHIHLAACGSNEYAWEKDGRGEFTAALLKAMRERGVNRVTYHNLIQVLPDLAQQTPHCYGAHKNRTVFNGHVPPQEVAYIPVTFDPDTKNTVLTLHAGYSSGVAEGSVWELRTSPTSGNEDIIGTATANSSGASETKLIWGEEDNLFREYCGSKLYARLLKSGSGSELKVWVSPEAKKLISPELQGGSQETTSMGAPEFNYVLCPDQDGADMIVEIYTPTGQSCEPTIGPVVEPNVGPKIQFRLCHPAVQKYGVATLRRHTSACGADVEKILFAAAKWHWYLNQTNPKCLQNPVKMDIFKIAERMKDHGGYSDTLREQVPRERWINLNNDQVNEVEFYPHERDLYGVRLSSKLDRPLYVRMFYFDTTTFCILNQFGHTGASGREDPDFNPPGEFIIGDDGDGGTPLPFSLDPGEALDVGFLKAFWSTDPLELGNVNQDSAFEMRSGRHGGTVGKLARETDWGTTTLVLVQRSPIGEDES